MKTIPLTRGMIAIVDDEHYEEISKYNWYAHKSGREYYACRRECFSGGKRRFVYMHRQIMNAQPGDEIDHKNGNRLDNKISNLRFCNHSQNLWNRHVSTGLSRYKGVFWSKIAKKWQAQIVCKGERPWLGYFDDEREAALAYDRAALKLFGEFACLNFPAKQIAS